MSILFTFKGELDRKTILSKKKSLVALHAVLNDSTKTEKWVAGKHLTKN